MPEQSFIPNTNSPPEQGPDVLGSALNAGKWGALGGATVGGVRGALKGDFLKNTLGGALLGALGAGGFTAYHKANPFQQGGVAGTAYQDAMQRALGEAVSGSPLDEVGSGAAQQALMSVLSGKGRFTPDEQSSLVQQFTQSTLPSQKGWERRISLADKVSNQLASGKPQAAYRGLKVMAQVMPDMDMRTAAEHALKRIETGRMRGPEDQAALAALGARMRSRLDMYRKATPAIGALSSMKSKYGGGKLSDEQLAQQVGILTGRFGSKDEKSQRMRTFLQQALARPVNKTAPGSLMGQTMAEAPEVGNLVMSALER